MIVTQSIFKSARLKTEFGFKISSFLVSSQIRALPEKNITTYSKKQVTGTIISGCGKGLYNRKRKCLTLPEIRIVKRFGMVHTSRR
jgi:hypothetical protein